MKRDWLPWPLIPVVAVAALPLVGSMASWVTLSIAGLAMGLMIFVMASGLTLTFGKAPQINVFATESERPMDPAGLVPTIEPAHRLLLSPVSFTCDVRKIPSQAELCAVCDSVSDPEQVRAMLVEKF